MSLLSLFTVILLSGLLEKSLGEEGILTVAEHDDKRKNISCSRTTSFFWCSFHCALQKANFSRSVKIVINITTDVELTQWYS